MKKIIKEYIIPIKTTLMMMFSSLAIYIGIMTDTMTSFITTMMFAIFAIYFLAVYLIPETIEYTILKMGRNDVKGDLDEEMD
jgi:multidrug efflux pump subunit AcrB